MNPVPLFPERFSSTLVTLFISNFVTLCVLMAFPAGFNALPASAQAYWLNRFSSGLNDPGTSHSLQWSSAPFQPGAWLVDWPHFVALHSFYLMGGMVLSAVLLIFLLSVLDSLLELFSRAEQFLCRCYPAYRRFCNPLEPVPDLVHHALAAGFTPEDIQAHVAQALHRETPQYQVRLKEAMRFLSPFSPCRDDRDRRIALFKELDPWSAPDMSDSNKQELSGETSK